MRSREAVLESALHLFVKKGFGGTTVNEIAEATGLTKGAVYFYFVDKASVLDALVQRAEDLVFAPIASAQVALDREAKERGALVIAPPAARGVVAALGEHSVGFASGWMQLRRRRQSMDRGFVFSDHADWPGLLRAIAATGAERVIVTHGQEAVMVRWLREQGLQAGSFGAERAEPASAELPVVQTMAAGQALGDTEAAWTGAS